MGSARRSAVFRELFECAGAGEIFTHASGIRAKDVSGVLVGRLPQGYTARPSRVVIRDTPIEGDLRLNGRTLVSRLSLYDCEVSGVISLLDAKLPGLVIDGGRVQWLDAANSEIAMELWLKNVTFASGIDLTDAVVGGTVQLEGSTFQSRPRPNGEDTSSAGCPLRLNRVDIKGALNAARISCAGMMDLADARVGAGIELEGARIEAPELRSHLGPPTAINAPGLHVGGSFTGDRLRLRTFRMINHTNPEIAYTAVVPVPEATSEGGPGTEAAAAGEAVAGPVVEPPARCVTRGRVYLANARIGGDVDLTGAMLRMPPSPGTQASADPVGPTIDAQHDFNSVLVLDRCEISGNVELDDGFMADGPVRMANAQIGGDLRLNGSSISGTNHVHDRRVYSVIADAVSVGGQVDASSSRINGEVRLRDAHIGHNLFFRYARLHTPRGNSLNVERATIGGTVDLTRVEARGTLRMLDVDCGPVVLKGALLSDPCTSANSSPFDAANEEFDPVLNLIGAHVRGFVQAGVSDAEEAEADPAAADAGAAVEAGADAGARPFRAEGAVSLRQANVTRSVRLSEAVVTASNTVAVQASGLTAADLNLDRVRITGGLVFAKASISGSVTLTNARLDVEPDAGAGGAAGAVPERGSADGSGPVPTSLDGSSATIGGDLLMSGLHADKVVRLRRATVLHRLDMRGTRLCDPQFALDMAGLHAPEIQLTPAHAVTGRVDISRIVTHIWMDNDNLWEPQEIDAWGMEFANLIDGDKDKQRKGELEHVLRRLDRTRILMPPDYGEDVKAPESQLQQPYQELARYYRERGLDRQARKILMRMRRREWRVKRRDRTRSPLRRGALAVTGWLYEVSLGYGFRLSGAFGILALLWLSGALVFSAYAKNAHAEPDTRPATTNCHMSAAADPVPTQPGYCGSYNSYLYSLDVLLPVVDLGQTSSWRFRALVPQACGAALEITGWLAASAAALAALDLVGGSGGSAEPTQPRWVSKDT